MEHLQKNVVGNYYLPTLPDDPNLYLDGEGNFTTPSAATEGFKIQAFSSVTQVVVSHNFNVEPVPVVIDDNGKVFDPLDITVTSTDVTVDFDRLSSGKVILTSGAPNFPTDISADTIQFNTTTPTITSEGQLAWNGEYHTLQFVTGLGQTIKIGQAVYIVYYNDTGVTIPAFRGLHLKSAIDVGGILFPTPELADASSWEKTQGTLSVSCCEILNGELGISAIYSDKLTDGDTSGVAAGAQLWLSDDGTGQLVDTKPVFPSYSISMGGSYNSDAVNGEIFVNITKDIYDTFGDGWDGAIRESFDFLVTSDGVTVTGTLTNADPANDLTLLLSDGFYRFETTLGKSITLTAGTDQATQTNYIYIPKSTKVLTLSTAGFP